MAAQERAEQKKTGNFNRELRGIREKRPVHRRERSGRKGEGRIQPSAFRGRNSAFRHFRFQRWSFAISAFNFPLFPRFR